MTETVPVPVAALEALRKRYGNGVGLLAGDKQAIEAVLAHLPDPTGEAVEDLAAELFDELHPRSEWEGVSHTPYRRLAQRVLDAGWTPPGVGQ